jgi:hypothetical protein
MSFFVSLVAGAFLLAVWVDAHCEGRRPKTPTWRIVHVGVSCVLIQLASILAGGLIGDHSGSALRPTIAALTMVLPALVYSFVSGLWLIRTLAELGFARR